MSETLSVFDLDRLNDFTDHVAVHAEGYEPGIRKAKETSITHLGDLMQSSNTHKRGYEITRDNLELVVDDLHAQMASFSDRGEANQAATKLRTIKGLSIIFPQYHTMKSERKWLSFDQQIPEPTTQSKNGLLDFEGLDDKTAIKLFLTALDTKDQYCDSKDHIAYIKAEKLADALESKYPGVISALREEMSSDHSLYE